MVITIFAKEMCDTCHSIICILDEFIDNDSNDLDPTVVEVSFYILTIIRPVCQDSCRKTTCITEWWVKSILSRACGRSLSPEEFVAEIVLGIGGTCQKQEDNDFIRLCWGYALITLECWVWFVFKSSKMVLCTVSISCAVQFL
jgi:hypothetical protein